MTRQTKKSVIEQLRFVDIKANYKNTTVEYDCFGCIVGGTVLSYNKKIYFRCWNGLLTSAK